MIRALFVLAPAVLPSAAVATMVHPFAGVVMALAIIGFGIQLTEAHPERGEGDGG